MKRLPNSALAAAALVLFAGCGKKDGKSGASPESSDNYSAVEKDDAEMNAAIAAAKKSSGDFLAALRAGQPSFHEFYVKKPYPTLSGTVEHMWIGKIEERAGQLHGIVANDAVETTKVALGDAVDLRIEEISDWKYQDGAKLIGGFTIRYFYDKMSPAEKASFRQETGYLME